MVYIMKNNIEQRKRIRESAERIRRVAFLLNPIMRNHAVPQRDEDWVPFKNPTVLVKQR
jgi:hypothetical protein